jgi:hypothetical protein
VLDSKARTCWNSAVLPASGSPISSVAFATAPPPPPNSDRTVSTRAHNSQFRRPSAPQQAPPRQRYGAQRMGIHARRISETSTTRTPTLTIITMSLSISTPKLRVVHKQTKRHTSTSTRPSCPLAQQSPSVSISTHLLSSSACCPSISSRPIVRDSNRAAASVRVPGPSATGAPPHLPQIRTRAPARAHERQVDLLDLVLRMYY